jgi:fatty acid desaturase
MSIDKLLSENKVEQAQSLARNKIKELRDAWARENISAVPNTCTSILFWCRDVIISMIGILFFYMFKNVLTNIFGYTLTVLLAGVIQGTIYTGLWVLGHECGHGAFSQYNSINNIFGYITHSLLLVPYFSWKYSHNKHHKYTNHLTYGETHVPMLRQSAGIFLKIKDVIGEDGFAFFQMITHLLFGWIFYLFKNDTGGRTTYDTNIRLNKNAHKSHFLPCQIFPPQLYSYVLLSTIGCLTTICGLVYVYFIYNVDLLYYYISPYIVVNAWLVLYTWLQHTDTKIPHYGEDIFTFEIGALSTIDRKYPAIVDHLHHHIGTTHVAHHINYKIPHYRAVRATELAKQILGREIYRESHNSILYDLWKTARECIYVNSVTGLNYLRN